jgi:ParB family chromosome partitioning protein
LPIMAPKKPDDKKEGLNPAPLINRAGSVTALGRVLDKTNEDRRIAEESHRAVEQDLAGLRKLIEGGSTIVEIDPSLIDPSPIRDRLDDPTSASIAEFTAGIAEHGQRTPALLRPNPTAPGRYLTVFGHRRLAAAKSLGRLLKAVIADLDDRQAFIAQGQENNERENTSFIEKCRYALHLRTFGMKGTEIAAATSTKPSAVSMMLAIAEKIPEDVIVAIGPAPTVGRPRWQALANLLPEKASACKATIGGDDFAGLSSDDRFQAILTAATKAEDPSVRFTAVNFLPIAHANGDPVALVKRSAPGEITLKIPKTDGSARADGRSFGDWFESRVSSLYDDWLKGL